MKANHTLGGHLCNAHIHQAMVVHTTDPHNVLCPLHLPEPGRVESPYQASLPCSWSEQDNIQPSTLMWGKQGGIRPPTPVWGE